MENRKRNIQMKLRYGRRKAADRREDEAASHKAVWGILPQNGDRRVYSCR